MRFFGFSFGLQLSRNKTRGKFLIKNDINFGTVRLAVVPVLSVRYDIKHGVYLQGELPYACKRCLTRSICVFTLGGQCMNLKRALGHELELIALHK
jgi:hypothetical protein